MSTPSLLALAVCTVPLAVTDIRERRLPNRWNLLLAVGGLAGQVFHAIQGHTFFPLRDAFIAGMVGLVFMMLLHVLSRGGLGMGDVKLVGALGVVIGDVMAVGVIVVVAFVMAAVWASLQLLIRRYHRRSRLAFGPFILFGAWLVVALP